jgi:erythromycin esterase
MAGGSDPHGVVGTGQVDSPDEGAGPDDVARWIDAHARPLVTYDPDAPPDDLTPLGDLADQATVVALGGSTRGAHELAALTQRAVRFLVGELGFRTLALEMGAAQSGALDRYVRTGDGRPRELLSRPGIRSFWRVEEVLGTVRWLRSYAEAHPDDPVRFTGVDSDDPLPVARPGPRPSDGGLELDRIEQALAENTVRWHERTGHKVAYWGGATHMARGHARSVSAPPGRPAVGRNAGSYLHEHFGSGYVPIGLTFHHGRVPYPVPEPAPELVDAVLGSAGPDAYLLDLRNRNEPVPPAVRDWLDGPARARLIGPRYDPDDDRSYAMSGGSLAGWYDAIVHVRQVTPTRPLS